MLFLRWYLALASSRPVWDPQPAAAGNRLLLETGDLLLLENGDFLELE